MVEIAYRKQYRKTLLIIIQYIAIISIIAGLTIAGSFVLNYSGIFEVNNTVHKDWSRTYRYERLKSALSILETIDETVDPCDDFYTFVCGSFINKTLNDTSSRHTQTNKDMLIELYKSIINIQRQNAPKPFKIVKTLFNSCMNKTSIEKLGVRPVVNIFETFHGWPTLEDNDSNNEFTWEQLNYDLQKIGMPMNIFIEFNIIQNISNNTNTLIKLSPPTTEISKYTNSIENYYESIIKAASALKVNVNNSKIQYELRNLFNFEIKLHQMSTSGETNRDSFRGNRQITINELKKKWTTINWQTILCEPLKAFTKLSDNDTVSIPIGSFLTNFEILMNSTPKRVLKNYALWKSLLFSIPYLNKKIREPYIEHRDRADNVERCLKIVKNKLPLATDAVYIGRNIKFIKSMKDIKKYANEMLENIQNRMVDVLSKIEWFDKETRKNAIDKVKATIGIMGYSDELLDNKKLTNYYENLNLDDNNYLQNILNIEIFNRIKMYNKFKEPFNKTDWTSFQSFIETNAYNMYTRNIIRLLIGLLKDTFFNINRNTYLNYGAIGTTIGHELFHSFDHRGMLYDKNGNWNNWWNENTKKKYVEKIGCLIHQYNNYTFEKINVKVNGVLTQGENIADSYGTRISYLAYKDWVKAHGHEARLPELRYTSDQLYWISYTHVRCTVYSVNTLKFLSTNPHPPYNLRSRGSLSNIPEFANDFKCPIGSNMNPQKKCTLW